MGHRLAGVGVAITEVPLVGHDRPIRIRRPRPIEHTLQPSAVGGDRGRGRHVGDLHVHLESDRVRGPSVIGDRQRGVVDTGRLVGVGDGCTRARRRVVAEVPLIGHDRPVRIRRTGAVEHTLAGVAGDSRRRRRRRVRRELAFTDVDEGVPCPPVLAVDGRPAHDDVGAGDGGSGLRVPVPSGEVAVGVGDVQVVAHEEHRADVVPVETGQVSGTVVPDRADHVALGGELPVGEARRVARPVLRSVEVQPPGGRVVEHAARVHDVVVGEVRHIRRAPATHVRVEPVDVDDLRVAQRLPVERVDAERALAALFPGGVEHAVDHESAADVAPRDGARDGRARSDLGARELTPHQLVELLGGARVPADGVHDTG